MDKVYNKLRNLDAYPKVNEDFYSRTLSGGVITLASSIVIALLFLSEFSDSKMWNRNREKVISNSPELGIQLRLYLHTVTESKLVVDTSRGGKLRINFDVTFPAIPCTLLSLDAMDISGERHLDIRHDIFKKRIDSHGNVIEVRQDGIGAPKDLEFMVLAVDIDISSHTHANSKITKSLHQMIERPLQRHGGRLEHNETYCGSCFGAETSDDDCCNSCEEVREAYRKRGWGLTNTDLIDQSLFLLLIRVQSFELVNGGIACTRGLGEGFVQKVKEEEGEGCNIHGSLEVNKVAGNFHFAPGKSFHQQNLHLLDLLALQTESYNISHKINKLSFGDSIPGIVNPLDGVQWVQEMPNGVYQYFIKVVPTIYTNIRGHTIQSNQFSVTEHYKSSEEDHFRSLPGVFFFYDLSPIKVTFTEEHASFLHFLTHICAIVGGIFTVAGIVDSFIYHGQKAIKKKMEIGKLR
ncbi:hypothetical protein DH2020_011101 [Rehmannia glutinosa]|uniref:Endoplasmic reticulum-Golgi intermediate compartment protein n=1 Tax=Rehmannia glutinosa TaxID=99300 RepID=A0ABR0XD37_REHGL